MNELSRCFAQALFSIFPDWERLAKAVDHDETGAVHMEIAVEQEGSDRVLHVSTADDEITIGFEHWHTHIGPFLGIDKAESVATAIAIIDSFVAEQSVVKASYRDGVWIESSLEYRAAPSEPKPHSTTAVFSWRRTYDETLENP